ncbi:FG-GAP repeat protein [Streptomyces thermolineatus]|uniref:FG-GAP repeat protein n=1 Tax=Streptomyces thermolineatus TaxID=44033 RepID=A0ABP5ZXH2_9ACTN
MNKRMSRALACAATVAAVTAGLVGTAGTASANSGQEADFNGDGYRDVAVSAPRAEVGGKSGAGAVVVHYGSANGLTKANRTVISQNSTGVPGSAEVDDAFGAMTAAGDFNGDGYTDLAVGAPREDVSGDTDGGTAVIVWGSASGLSGGTTVADPRPANHDRFGKALAAADFNGDGRHDLAVGSTSPVIDIHRGGFTKSGGTGGAYTVKAPIMGSGNGVINLTPGDINNDGIADLVVDGFETETEYGWNTNYYLPGSASGVTATGTAKLPAGVITDIGDINHDGYGDIVIGLDFDADSGVPGASTGGKVNIVWGSASGPSGNYSTITQNSPGIPGGSEAGDAFGGELHLGDINGDGHLDLAVGAPGETLGGKKYTGAVTVVYGAAGGLNAEGAPAAQFFDQETAGVPGSGETDDWFGSDVHLSDLNNDGKADLTIGVAGENGSNGALVALRSNGTKITTTGAVAVSASGAGLSTAGTPRFGINFAG